MSEKVNDARNARTCLGWEISSELSIAFCELSSEEPRKYIQVCGTCFAWARKYHCMHKISVCKSTCDGVTMIHSRQPLHRTSPMLKEERSQWTRSGFGTAISLAEIMSLRNVQCPVNENNWLWVRITLRIRCYRTNAGDLRVTCSSTLNVGITDFAP
jgi:hypothetical protein